MYAVPSHYLHPFILRAFMVGSEFNPYKENLVSSETSDVVFSAET